MAAGTLTRQPSRPPESQAVTLIIAKVGVMIISDKVEGVILERPAKAQRFSEYLLKRASDERNSAQELG
jgi:hypothetical protein